MTGSVRVSFIADSPPTIIAFVAQTVGGAPPLVRLLYSMKSCSIYYGALNYGKKNTRTAQTSSCLFALGDATSLEKDTITVYPLTLCAWRRYFHLPFFSSPSHQLFCHHNDSGEEGESWGGGGDPFLNPTGVCVTQTNQYAVIVPRPRPCVPLRRAASAGRGGEGRGREAACFHSAGCLVRLLRRDDAPFTEMAQ